MAGGRGESYQEVTATRQAEEGELRQTNTAGVDIWWAAALEDDTVGEGRKTVATVAVTMAAADLAVAETVVAGSAVRAEAATDAAMAAAASRELRQMVVRR